MITKNKQLLETIVDLERQLQELKLDLSSNDREPNYTDPLEVGEEVVILNPKEGTGIKRSIRQNTPENQKSNYHHHQRKRREREDSETINKHQKKIRCQVIVMQ